MPSHAHRVLATLFTLTVLALVASPVSAQAACSIGGSGVTYNCNGEAAVFKSLRPTQDMNTTSRGRSG